MDIMEFLQTNYVAIIVVSVIVIMTVIGYIADKHDFGKNEKKVKEKNTIKSIQEDNLIEEDKSNSNDVDSNLLNNFEMPVESINEFDTNFVQEVEPVQEEINFAEEQQENPDEDLYASFGDIDNSFVEEQQENPDEKLYTGFDDMDNSFVDEQYNEQENSNIEMSVDEQPIDIYKEVEPTENNVEETLFLDELPVEPDYQPIEEESKENLQIELPSIDTLNEEMPEVEDDEDIWKF